MSYDNPIIFVVILQDGDDKVKLRIRQADLPDQQSHSGRDVASAILSQMDGISVIHAYHKKEEVFVLLDQQLDVAKDLGSRLLCSIQIDATQDVAVEDHVLAIEGRFYPYEDGMIVLDTRLTVREMPNIPGAGTGLNVWDGAVLLVKYLEQTRKMIQGSKVLELGAGCGLVGIAASLLGAETVILTDLAYTMELMQSNVSLNQTVGSIDCRLCDWFDPPVFDESWTSNVVLVADCVWVEELVAPLLSTIERFIASSSGTVEVIVSYQRRGKVAHDLFWEGMNNIFHTVQMAELMIDKPENLNIFQCTASC